jgi:hypothetical protein
MPVLWDSTIGAPDANPKQEWGWWPVSLALLGNLELSRAARETAGLRSDAEAGKSIRSRAAVAPTETLNVTPSVPLAAS